MSHVRTQIRERLKDALEAALPASQYVVFGSRKYPRNRVKGQAVVDMRFLNINVEQQTMDDLRVHTASLYVRVQREAPEESLDDTLDDDEVLLTQIVESTDWSDLLEEDPELMQVNFSEDSDSEVAIGAIILRYDVEYRIDKTNPEIARG